LKTLKSNLNFSSQRSSPTAESPRRREKKFTLRLSVSAVELILFFLLGLLSFGYGNEAPESTKVIVLGTAQDGGVPQIGCNQEICKTQRHFVTSLAVVHGNALYLIDATPDLRDQHRQLVNRYPELSKTNLFDAIFLTHAHMGHYSGLLFLGKESISTRQIPVFCSSEMASYLTKNAPWSLLIENKNIDLHPFKSGKEMDFGFRIMPLAVPHRKEFTDTYGFMIQGANKSLLYIPDIDSWGPVKDSLAKWLTHSDYALIDGTFYSASELPGRNIKLVPHPTIEHSMEFFHALPKFKSRIYFTHLNHTNPVFDLQSSERKKIQDAGYAVAVDWQEFPL
jgi:pyrroloquinoline quinone biosynthesis protein B